MLGNPYQQYQNNAVVTASQGELTLMLYNGAIKFCNLTIEAIENKDIKRANEFNIRVQDIIAELQISLDTTYEVGKEMDRLYTFIQELLISGNIQKDKTKILDAQYLIREFRDTWKEVLKSAR